MEISILLTILLMIVSLGRLSLQEGKVFLINEEQIDGSLRINDNLNNTTFRWAVKFVLKEIYLLNTVALFDAQKAIQTTLIQIQNHNFRG